MATIPPANIKSLDQWVRAFDRYRNVRLGPDGSFLVLDPKLMKDDPVRAMKEPTVRFKHTYARDALLTLIDSSADGDTRTEALDTIAKALEQINVAKNEAFRAFVSTEQALLEAADIAKRAKTATQRMTAALEVAKQTGLMMAAGQTYSERRMPLRSVKTLYGIPRNAIDYTTNDDRAIPSLMILEPKRIGSLTVEDTA